MPLGLDIDRLRFVDQDNDFGFVGTPQQVVEQMRTFAEVGVDCFMLDCAGFPELTPLTLLIDQVLPAWTQIEVTEARCRSGTKG
jgi:alkanesulfonate monooxygenase SsuD/methylene tetrahydromethanopterin reductase-like flavin-dependent oxidoreductase (luciferase family)